MYVFHFHISLLWPPYACSLDIPLSYLIKHSRVLSSIFSGIPETTIVKAIRAYAVDFIDVRLSFAAPSSSGWYRGGSSSRPSQGGYEVRRKDWVTACRSASSTYSKSDWESLTLYIVCFQRLS